MITITPSSELHQRVIETILSTRDENRREAFSINEVVINDYKESQTPSEVRILLLNDMGIEELRALDFKYKGPYSNQLLASLLKSNELYKVEQSTILAYMDLECKTIVLALERDRHADLIKEIAESDMFSYCEATELNTNIRETVSYFNGGETPNNDIVELLKENGVLIPPYLAHNLTKPTRSIWLNRFAELAPLLSSTSYELAWLFSRVVGRHVSVAKFPNGSFAAIDINGEILYATTTVPFAVNKKDFTHDEKEKLVSELLQAKFQYLIESTKTISGGISELNGEIAVEGNDVLFGKVQHYTPEPKKIDGIFFKGEIYALGTLNGEAVVAKEIKIKAPQGKVVDKDYLRALVSHPNSQPFVIVAESNPKTNRYVAVNMLGDSTYLFTVDGNEVTIRKLKE
jgi:hypothetical protein